MESEIVTAKLLLDCFKSTNVVCYRNCQFGSLYRHAVLKLVCLQCGESSKICCACIVNNVLRIETCSGFVDIEEQFLKISASERNQIAWY